MMRLAMTVVVFCSVFQSAICNAESSVDKEALDFLNNSIKEYGRWNFRDHRLEKNQKAFEIKNSPEGLVLADNFTEVLCKDLDAKTRHKRIEDRKTVTPKKEKCFQAGAEIRSVMACEERNSNARAQVTKYQLFQVAYHTHQGKKINSTAKNSKEKHFDNNSYSFDNEKTAEQFGNALTALIKSCGGTESRF